MVDVKSLWIGDGLRIVKSGRTGRFEGIHKSGKLRIRIDDKVILADARAVELYEEEAADDLDLGLETETSPVKAINAPPDQIDLHIEVLAPHLAHQRPERILLHQMEACKAFVADAAQRRRYSVKIIHGKGEGVLRNEVHHYLRMNPTVALFTPSPDGGSTDVFLR